MEQHDFYQDLITEPATYALVKQSAEDIARLEKGFVILDQGLQQALILILKLDSRLKELETKASLVGGGGLK